MLAMFLLFLLKEPQTAMEGARYGLMLWAKQLLPSLLPFLILTQLLIRSGYLSRISETLHLPQVLPMTYAILYAPSLCYGLLMLMIHHRRLSHHTQSSDCNVTKKATSGLQMNFAILDAGIMNSFETMLKLGGYVMLFAVITRMCQHYLTAIPVISTFIASLLEITGAVSVLNHTIQSTYLKYVAILGATAFGGCSGIAQTASLIHTDHLPEQRSIPAMRSVQSVLSMRSYICGRLCIAAITALLAAVLYPLAAVCIV